jgi:hypothetical protein
MPLWKNFDMDKIAHLKVALEQNPKTSLIVCSFVVVLRQSHNITQTDLKLELLVPPLLSSQAHTTMSSH